MRYAIQLIAKIRITKFTNKVKWRNCSIRTDYQKLLSQKQWSKKLDYWIGKRAVQILVGKIKSDVSIS